MRESGLRARTAAAELAGVADAAVDSERAGVKSVLCTGDIVRVRVFELLSARDATERFSRAGGCRLCQQVSAVLT